MKTIAFALISSLAAAACYPANSAGPQIQTAASPSAPLAEYRTFSFGLTENSPAAYQASARSLEVEHRMRQLVGSALREKGFVEQDAQPNFLVRFGAGTQKVETASYVEPDPERSSQGDAIDLQEMKVDIYDASTKTEVWKGSAVSQVDLAKAIDDTMLQRQVQSMLATFPDRSATAGEPARNPLAAKE
jgi:hypothetical protein